MDTLLGDAVVRENLKQFLLVLSVSLTVATLSRVVSQLREVPYSILLVVVGLFLALFDVRLIDLSPDITLFVFLPALLFKSAWDLDWQVLRRDLIPIYLFALGGSLATALGITLALTRWADLPLETAALIGISLAATAPAPVSSLFRRLGIEKRVTTLTEGENLFNSAIAIAAFTLLMAMPLGSRNISLVAIFTRGVALITIGAVVGSLIAVGIAFLMRRADAPFLTRSLLLVSAYGTYLLTEDLGGSGVVAVVAAGLILGNFGAEGVDSGRRQLLDSFLGFVAFFVNSIVFLLIGDQINYRVLGENLLPIGLAIVAAVGGRAVAIFGLGSLANSVIKSQISWRLQCVLWWVGLKGSVSIALALSVPVLLVQRETIIATVFGVVLFTLLVQGSTTKLLLDQLGFLADRQIRQQYLSAIARSLALGQICYYLEDVGKTRYWGSDPELARYKQFAKAQLAQISETLDGLEAEHPSLKVLSEEQLRRELITIEREVYNKFSRAGLLSEIPIPLMSRLVPGRLPSTTSTDSPKTALSESSAAQETEAEFSSSPPEAAKPESIKPKEAQPETNRTINGTEKNIAIQTGHELPSLGAKAIEEQLIAEQLANEQTLGEF